MLWECGHTRGTFSLAEALLDLVWPEFYGGGLKGNFSSSLLRKRKGRRIEALLGLVWPELHGGGD
jgi:hypothetical protein